MRTITPPWTETSQQLTVGGRSDAIAHLSSLEGLARSVAAAIMPFVALSVLGDKRTVSLAYVVASLAALCMTLNLGWLERVLGRRRLMVGSATLMACGSALLMVSSAHTVAVALVMIATHTAVFAGVISLVTIHQIDRRDIAVVESQRLLYTGIAWTLGPILSAWLWTRFGPAPALAVSIGFSGLLVVYARRTPVVHAPETVLDRRRAAANVSRFFSQRALRIAYVIPFARGIFWAAFAIYAPIYVIEAGLPIWVAGVLLSAVAALLLLSPLVRRLAEQRGVRYILVRGFVVLAIALASLAALGDPQPIGLLSWGAAALAATAIDVLGNVPFFRLVRPREATSMTAVFSTWRDTTAVTAPALASLVLAVAPFEVYYAILALISLAAALSCTCLPKRL